MPTTQNTEPFDQLLRRRLGIIQDQGVEATQATKQLEDRKRQEAAMNQQIESDRLSRQAASQASQWRPPGGLMSGGTSGGMSGGSSGGGGNNLDSFIQAISGQESGGNYGAVNPSSGAMGRYQIMPGNIASWSRQALGHSVSRSQFLHSPQIQDAVARYQLGNYYRRYGAAGAAVAWYAGPGAVSRYMHGGGRGRQGNYPSIRSYVQQVLGRMH